MKKQEFWNIANVSSFRNIDVVNGEVSLSESEWEERLDEIHGDVIICGMSYGSGRALRELDPVAFRCGKNDEESSIQSELETQLEREDSDDIEFIDGDEDDLNEGGTYDEGLNARKNGEACDYNMSEEWQDGWNDADDELADE